MFMSLTRREFLRYLSGAIGYVAFRSVFPDISYAKRFDLSHEYIPEVGRDWYHYMGRVYAFTSGPKGKRKPRLLNEKNFKEGLEFILSKQNLYEDYIKPKIFARAYFLIPYHSPYLHPELEKELYRYFRRAVSKIVGVDDILECKIEPKGNNFRRKEYVAQFSSLLNGKKYILKIKYDDIMERVYKEYLRSPPIALVLCKTLVRKQILDRPEIYLDQVAVIDEKRKILRFYSKKDFENEGALEYYYWMKPKYRKLMGRVIKLDSLDDAAKYLFWLRRDAVILFGGDYAWTPVFGFGRIDDLLKEKTEYRIYFEDAAEGLSYALKSGPPGNIKIKCKKSILKKLFDL